MRKSILATAMIMFVFIASLNIAGMRVAVR